MESRLGIEPSGNFSEGQSADALDAVENSGSAVVAGEAELAENEIPVIGKPRIPATTRAGRWDDSLTEKFQAQMSGGRLGDGSVRRGGRRRYL